MHYVAVAPQGELSPNEGRPRGWRWLWGWCETRPLVLSKSPATIGTLMHDAYDDDRPGSWIEPDENRGFFAAPAEVPAEEPLPPDVAGTVVPPPPPDVVADDDPVAPDLVADDDPVAPDLAAGDDAVAADVERAEAEPEETVNASMAPAGAGEATSVDEPPADDLLAEVLVLEGVDEAPAGDDAGADPDLSGDTALHDSAPDGDPPPRPAGDIDLSAEPAAPPDGVLETDEPAHPAALVDAIAQRNLSSDSSDEVDLSRDVSVAAEGPETAVDEPEDVALEPVRISTAGAVGEVFSSRRPRPFRLGGRAAAVLASLLALLTLSSAGISYAAYDYGRDYDGRILPGATIAGVSVGGMSRDRAVAAVSAAIEPRLTRRVVVQWGDRKWKVTPGKLGARSDAADAVDAALRASERSSLLERARMRVLGEDFHFDRPVAITYPRKQIRGFVEGLASAFDTEPVDAHIDYSSGWVEVRKEREGRRVKVARSARSLLAGLREEASHVPLAVAVKAPDVKAEDFGQILLLRIGENKLYLYEGGEIVRTWTVATGQPEYPTPTGTYEITLKRYLPTWVNPAPDTWGAGMPASIPPGPGNPLGLRALNWSAPAIRFHGTSATYSLGYNASHGCVRMANEDVIELYDLVEVGTPIVSVVVAPLRPLYSSAPDPTPVPAG